MRHLGQTLAEFLTKEDGPTAVEYAVMLALICIVIFTAVLYVGTATSANFNSPKIASAMTSGSSS
jgi:pilus assembly protein Flp/PilA